MSHARCDVMRDRGSMCIPIVSMGIYFEAIAVLDIAPRKMYGKQIVSQAKILWSVSRDVVFVSYRWKTVTLFPPISDSRKPQNFLVPCEYCVCGTSILVCTEQLISAERAPSLRSMVRVIPSDAIPKQFQANVV